MSNYNTAINSLNKILSKIDYNQLPISDYNKHYINRIKPAFLYYFKIYAACINEGLKNKSQDLSQLTMIDFGGGSGFLSILAKHIGIGQVIYVDINPNSVETISLLKETIGFGPDVILNGSSDTLSNLCKEKNIQPDLLIATDLIEHVYDLETFFCSICNINKEMHMAFTTASTPYNPFLVKRLHRIMERCEHGKEGYLKKRIDYIKKNFPELSSHDVKKWAFSTRGLIYGDIEKVIKEKKQPLLLDAYNTCDPETGNWTERILPIKDYRNILSTNDYSLSILKGFYNADRPNPVKSTICKAINAVIGKTGKAGLLIAPFIVLSCIGKRS